MTIERTLSILKPDVTRRRITGVVNALIEESGFSIIAQKRVLWSSVQAEAFYSVHKERSFFRELVTFMTSGPIILQVLEKEAAVSAYRTLMGATNPANADAGTIRKIYGLSIEENSVHGSDSLENAQQEIALCFAGMEIVG